MTKQYESSVNGLIAGLFNEKLTKNTPLRLNLKACFCVFAKALKIKIFASHFIILFAN